MRVELNHTIVWCRDQQQSAAFLIAILGLPEPAIAFGPMLVVRLANGVSLDFYTHDSPIAPQHYAFLVDEGSFDAILARIRDQGLPHWAAPGRLQPGETYRHNGGRGVYFDDPDGHLLEVMTRPHAGIG